jgi:cell division septation protein DedD
MAKNLKRSGGDRVLESRHLVLLFLSVVLLCGVFFTLGYVMGHTQYGGSVHAADVPAATHPQPLSATPKTKQPSTAPSTTADKGGWGDDPAKTDDTGVSTESKPAPAPKSVPVASTPSSPKAKSVPLVEKQPAKYNPPPTVGKNSIVLQVAAVKQQRDALEMADELQKKKFPAFILNSQTDGYIHVQVGPYPDKASAEAARRALEQAGFKAIIKR